MEKQPLSELSMGTYFRFQKLQFNKSIRRTAFRTPVFWGFFWFCFILFCIVPLENKHLKGRRISTGSTRFDLFSLAPTTYEPRHSELIWCKRSIEEVDFLKLTNSCMTLFRKGKWIGFGGKYYIRNYNASANMYMPPICINTYQILQHTDLTTDIRSLLIKVIYFRLVYSIETLKIFRTYLDLKASRTRASISLLFFSHFCFLWRYN